jgi:septum formation protein
MPSHRIPIILASQSQSRRHILKAAGVSFKAIAPDVNEAVIKKTQSHLGKKQLAKHLAEAKALSLSKQHLDAIIIGSDQTLEFEGRKISKPKSIKEACTQLRAMRGKSHQLHSGVACAMKGNLIWSHVASARLTMRQFSDQFLEDYLDRLGDDVMTSVGGYKIEGLGLQLFDKVNGAHDVIMGMPLLPLLAILRKQDAIIP